MPVPDRFGKMIHVGDLVVNLTGFSTGDPVEVVAIRQGTKSLGFGADPIEWRDPAEYRLWTGIRSARISDFPEVDEPFESPKPRTVMVELPRELVEQWAGGDDFQGIFCANALAAEAGEDISWIDVYRVGQRSRFTADQIEMIHKYGEKWADHF